MVRIGWGIHRFWSVHGHTGEERRWMEQGLARPDDLSDSARARALYVVSMLSYIRGRWTGRSRPWRRASPRRARRATGRHSPLRFWDEG